MNRAGEKTLSLVECPGVGTKTRGLTVQDLKAKLEKLLTEAEDCELIGRLATDVHKRELFLRLAVDLRAMARDIDAMIATRPPVTK
jgi:hypothetical protein